MKRLIGFFKQHKAICIVFAIIFIVKVMFFLNCNILQYPDSYDYIGINGFNIFKLKLDEFRVFVYPLILEVFEKLYQQNGLFVVCIVQMLVSFISSIYFFKTLNLLSKKIYLNLFATVLYSCSLVIIGWEKAILTESFSLSLTVFLIYNLVSYLQYKNKKHSINLAIITAIGTFIRPTFLIYACIILAFFVLRFIFIKNEKMLSLKCCAFSLIPIILILSYSLLFYQQYQQFTLSNSLLGQQVTYMVQTDLFKKSTDKEIVDTIYKIYVRKDLAPMPYYARLEVMKLYDRPRISKFVNDIKKYNMSAYTQKLTRTTWDNFTSNFASYYIPKEGLSKEFHYVYNSLFRYAITFLQGMIIAIIALILLIAEFLRKKKFDWIYFGIFGFVFLTYITSIIGTNSEYTRTAVTSIPFIALALYLYIDKISTSLNNLSNKKNMQLNNLSNEDIIGEDYEIQ